MMIIDMMMDLMMMDLMIDLMNLDLIQRHMICHIHQMDDEDDIKNTKKKYDNLLLKHFQLIKNMKETKDELDKTKDELDKKKRWIR